MNRIDLRFQHGFEWVSSGNIALKGYVFDKEGEFFAAQEAVRLFHPVDGIKALEKILKQVDGVFTLVIDLPEGTLIATDPICGFPLFYTKKNGAWMISDHVDAFKEQKSHWEFNEAALPEFLSAGFVLGNETLVRDIIRTQAAEILCLHHNGNKEQKQYYWFLPDHFSNQKKSVLKQELKSILQNTTNRLIKSLEGKTAVVPLSGGYDSRLIACMLKNAGYEQTICFTYGRPNKESEISKRVAEALGFKWFFVDYSKINTNDFTANPGFIDYCNYAGNISSMPYLQEYFAVKHLKENKLIPENSIFIPGHTGDYIAGSYLEKTIRTKRNRLHNDGKTIAARYFNFLPLSSHHSQIIKDRIERWFGNYTHPVFEASSNYDATTEDWDLKEKFSKFIFNSSQVFPFFGYQFRFPLWDAKLRTFFRRLPFELRKYKVLYDEVIQEEYFIPANVFFHQEELNVKPSALRFKNLRDKLKFLVPHALKRNRLKNRDYLCYHVFTGEMKRSLIDKGVKVPARINSYNTLICLWYSEIIRQKLTS